MVETAIVFPVLVFLLLLIVQFTLFLHTHNVIEAAAQDALRVYAQDNSTEAAARTRFEEVKNAGVSRNVDARPTFKQNADTVEIDVSGSMPTYLVWWTGNRIGRLNLSLDMQMQGSRERFRR
jgi:Flp pilus assembly protein TadG